MFDGSSERGSDRQISRVGFHAKFTVRTRVGNALAKLGKQISGTVAKVNHVRISNRVTIRSASQQKTCVIRHKGPAGAGARVCQSALSGGRITAERDPLPLASHQRGVNRSQMKLLENGQYADVQEVKSKERHIFQQSAAYPPKDRAAIKIACDEIVGVRHNREKIES